MLCLHCVLSRTTNQHKLTHLRWKIWIANGTIWLHKPRSWLSINFYLDHIVYLDTYLSPTHGIYQKPACKTSLLKNVIVYLSTAAKDGQNFIWLIQNDFPIVPRNLILLDCFAWNIWLLSQFINHDLTLSDNTWSQYSAILTFFKSSAPRTHIWWNWGK
mgnify:CR=1 FL=1